MIVKFPDPAAVFDQNVWFAETYVLICSPYMKAGKRTYSFLHLASAVIMILLLMWLTVSTPFVYASQQEQAKHSKSCSGQPPLSGTEEENANPFGNSTEEKTPKNITSFSEEYLHDQHKTDYLFSITLQYHKIENAGTYTAFHGELLVPPPNVL